MLHIIDKQAFQKEVLDEKEKPVLVDFFAPWCPPCKIIAPILEQIVAENKNVKIVKVDVDQAQELAQEYNVMSIPTLYVFKQGKVVQQFVGAQSKETLEEGIK